MIWKRKEADDEATVQAIRNRFATVLGLDSDEGGNSSCLRADPSESMSKAYGEPHAFAPAINNSPEIRELDGNFTGETLDRLLSQAETRVESCSGRANLPLTAPSTESGAVRSERLLSILDAETAHLVQKTKELIETQTKLFEDTLARIVSQAFSQAEAKLHEAVSCFETSYAQATQTEQRRNRREVGSCSDNIEPALTHADTFEGDLANIARRCAYGTQADAAMFTPLACERDPKRA